MKLLILAVTAFFPVLVFGHDGQPHAEPSLMLGLTSEQLQMGVVALGIAAAGVMVFIKRR